MYNTFYLQDINFAEPWRFYIKESDNMISFKIANSIRSFEYIP